MVFLPLFHVLFLVPKSCFLGRKKKKKLLFKKKLDKL